MRPKCEGVWTSRAGNGLPHHTPVLQHPTGPGRRSPIPKHSPACAPLHLLQPLPRSHACTGVLGKGTRDAFACKDALSFRLPTLPNRAWQGLIPFSSLSLALAGVLGKHTRDALTCKHALSSRLPTLAFPTPLIYSCLYRRTGQGHLGCLDAGICFLPAPGRLSISHTLCLALVPLQACWTRAPWMP